MARPLQAFLRLEASSGLVLLAATLVALVWANTATGSYVDLWSTEVTLTVGDWSLEEDLLHVVNDGLMTLFFLVIGLEVKRELTVGELRTRRAAMLPLAAAAGGMVLPAAIYLAVLGGDPGSSGWGVPIATDVAFALGALAALGSRVPPALLAFLLGVAVIDDIGAILVIAIAYSSDLSLAWLAVAGAGLLAIAALNRVGVRYLGIYLIVGAVVWFATFESGVHATIAGVVLGLMTPARPFQPPDAVRSAAAQAATGDEAEARWGRLAWLAREAQPPLDRIEHALHPWSSFVVLPIFALANAGIVLSGEAIEAATETRVALGIVMGLVLGKMLGLTLGAFIAVRLGLSSLPRGVRWTQIVGVASLAGIGFTVSLFITDLAFTDPALVAAAKIGVLCGSTIALLVGLALLLSAARRAGEPSADPPPT
ncbi:MAG: Na+/H+ antiporter NhaA [Miltoncostaeaceae bacterium]